MNCANEKNKSNVVNELRRNLYQMHGYDCPEEPLFMNEDAVVRKQRAEQMIQKNIAYLDKKVFPTASDMEEAEAFHKQIDGNVNAEHLKLMNAIESVGWAIKILSSKNISAVEIDAYLNNKYKLYDLPEVLDFVLAVSVKVLFMVADEFENFRSVAKILREVVEITFEVVLSEIEKPNSGAENYIGEVITNEFEINTQHLELGQVIKNYKELCAILGQTPTTGKAKQLQLKEFQRYFEWEKSGQKFIITDIYDTPLTKEDKRKLGNNSIYAKYIELILLQFLSKQKDETRTFKKRDWWQLLGMVTDKYNKISQNKLKQISPVVTTFEIKHFYQRCNKRLEQILFSALKNLQNRKLIVYELQTVIVDNYNNYFCADDNDKRRILETERYILHNVMGYEKIIQVFCRFKQDEYYRMVNQRLSDLYNWHYYFKQVKIMYIQKDVLEAIPKTEVDLQKEILNQKIVNVLNEDAQKKYKLEKEKWELQRKNLCWGEYKDYDLSTENTWKIPDTYLEAQKILVDELIHIGHKQEEERNFIPVFEEDDEMNQIFNSFLH